MSSQKMKRNRRLSASTSPSMRRGKEREDRIVPLVPHVAVHVAEAVDVNQRLIRVTTTSMIAVSGSTW